VSVASINIPVELAPMETATDPALPAFALRVKVDAFVIEFEITLHVIGSPAISEI